MCRLMITFFDFICLISEGDFLHFSMMIVGTFPPIFFTPDAVAFISASMPRFDFDWRHFLQPFHFLLFLIVRAFFADAGFDADDYFRGGKIISYAFIDAIFDAAFSFDAEDFDFKYFRLFHFADYADVKYAFSMPSLISIFDYFDYFDFLGFSSSRELSSIFHFRWVGFIFAAFVVNIISPMTLFS